VFQDGFGERIPGVDHVSGDMVEQLSFVPSLAGVPAFAEAVGERVARLARVRHAMYARVRRIDRPSPATLVLFSDRVDGWRVADMLRVIEREQLALDISAVLVLLRQLIPAVALFSRHQRDAAIGTIGPERLILTGQGRLVLSEYVMAPGLERLQYSRDRLWREFRVAIPPTASTARIPPSADVVGIGMVALSLLLGRLLRDDEYLVSLGELVESVTELHAGERRKLSPGFATWLGRVLQFDEHQGLRSPQEAQIAFEEMLAKERSYVTAPAQLELFIEKYEQLTAPPAVPDPPVVAPPASLRDKPFAAVESIAPNIAIAAVVPSARVVAHAPEAIVASAAAPSPVADKPEAPVESIAAGAAEATVASADPSKPDAAVVSLDITASPVAPGETALAADPPPLDATSPSSTTWPRAVAATLAAVAIGEAAFIGWLLMRTPASLNANGEIVVQSRPVAARVSIDGEEKGITPYTAELSEGSHVLEVRVGRSEPRVIPVQIRGGVQSGIYVELQSVATVGGLEVRSAPVSARVSVAGQYRGDTPLVLKDLPPGDHEVLLQSKSRQVRQTVRIEPGITSQLVVPFDR
jgi:hypothetical protein